jgi:hypothetical protein
MELKEYLSKLISKLKELNLASFKDNPMSAEAGVDPVGVIDKVQELDNMIFSVLLENFGITIFIPVFTAVLFFLSKVNTFKPLPLTNTIMFDAK